MIEFVLGLLFTAAIYFSVSNRSTEETDLDRRISKLTVFGS